MSPATNLSALDRLQLARPPVALAFLDAPPPGLQRIERPAAAGCAYWKQALDGHGFYTTSEDHQNCPVGAFTHGVEMSEETSGQLESLVGTMVELKYLRGTEVPEIPRRTAPFRVAAYAPLSQATFAPDLVIFRGSPRQIMLLTEAARAAGAFGSTSTMGRPACAMLPDALNRESGVASVGCIGNRVYTGLGDDELYLAVPGRFVKAMFDELDATISANATLEAFHRDRAAALS